MTAKQKKIFYLVLGALVVLPLIFVDVTITGNLEGIFLLKGKGSALLELKDDLYLNEANRYIAGIDLVGAKELFFHRKASGTGNERSLFVDWSSRKGSGYIRSLLPGNRQMITCFSRFVDDGGKEVRGIFVGGGLPANVKDDDIVKENETGMAYYDGARWYHIWCNVNEAIFSLRQFEAIAPSSWKFLGSRVLNREPGELMLESSHEVEIDGIPLRIDRYAAFRAGDTYFVLSIFITNIGGQSVTYSYQYGDEPWLGDYGTSAGNVGWANDGLHKYVGDLDPKRTSYAGFFDHGNDAAGEGRGYTGVSNFLKWFGTERPRVYFTNGPFESPRTAGRKVPLSGNARFIGLQWGPRTIHPDETVNYTLAIGMADRDPVTGFPVMPKIDSFSFP